MRATCVLCMLAGFSLSTWALDRDAFTFTAYEVEARVDARSQGFEARARLTLRNDSSAPQRALALQISSTLAWKSVRAGNVQQTYVAQPYFTDIDHSGSVAEAIVTLAREVPPQGTVELNVSYGGIIPLDTTRLTRIGTPAQVAARSDWDRISESFTAVRGVGYVAWYPVAMPAVNLSEPGAYSQAMGAWKARHARSTMKLAITAGAQQTVITNGRPVSERTAQQPAVEFEFAGFGLSVPTLVVANYTVLQRPALTIYHLDGHQAAAADYALAAEKTLPIVSDWFGAAREKVQLVELADANAAPFESGPMLLRPLLAGDRKSLEMTLAHQLVHASLASPRPWIYEGLAHFAQALVRERQDGRKAALAYMGGFRPALVEAEKIPADRAAAFSLVATGDEVLYRTKAMFVWWMLRDMLGDHALQRALSAYRSDQDREPSYMQRLIESQARRSLEWFFDDWVYRDRGLPDFRVEAAYPRAILGGGSMVTVTVENLGNAGAEVPVVVRAQGGEVMKRLLAPAKAKASVRIEVPTAPLEATVNDGSVPESDVGNNSLAVR
jgi:hypothetical protein